MYIKKTMGYVVETHKISGTPSAYSASEPYRVTKIGRVLTMEEEGRLHKSTSLAAIRQRDYRYYRVIAENDNRFYSVCRDNDGKIYLIADAKEGSNLPPFHPNCRCRVESVSLPSLNNNPLTGAEIAAVIAINNSKMSLREKREALWNFLRERFGAAREFLERLIDALLSGREGQPEQEEQIEGSNAADLFEYDWVKEGLPSSEHVTPEFMQAVIGVAERLQINRDDLMAVMAYESWFNPQAINPIGATGLIQFTQIAIDDINRRANLVPPLTRDSLLQMTAIEQLEYVYLYYLPYVGRMGNVGDMYMATLWPAAIGQPDDFVLWAEGSVYYRQNRGLDINNDGVITRGEAIQRVLQRREVFNR